MFDRLYGDAMMKKNEERMKIQSDQEPGHRYRSERGVALVLVLVLSAIGLLVMTTVLYVITMGTQISGSEKRYRTAHEAALGGIDIVRKILQDQAESVIPGVTITYQPTFLQKLSAASLEGYDTNVSIDPNTASTYDITMDIGNPEVYRVYVKMVQKKQGNTNKGYKNVRMKTGVVPADPGMGLKNMTYYTITMLAQKATNPIERSRMDLVHVF
jgi:hypothetical protein